MWAGLVPPVRGEGFKAEDKTQVLRKLNAFYESHGILPISFRCPSRSTCSANSPHFTEAKASFVGPSYEERHLPRLLFLSLDSGSADPDPRQRTAEAVRRQTLATDVAALPQNRHWYRTHELAFELLRPFKADLTVPDTRLYFAHVNSAKCCQNKPQSKQADKTLFENCRRFISAELRILSPDIVVTQGNPAKDAILKSFAVRQHDVRTVDGAHYETGFIELEPGTNRCLWLQTYHPANFGRFYPQRTHCWPLYAEAVGEFWLSHGKGRGRGQRRAALPRRRPLANVAGTVRCEVCKRPFPQARGGTVCCPQCAKDRAATADRHAAIAAQAREWLIAHRRRKGLNDGQ